MKTRWWRFALGVLTGVLVACTSAIGGGANERRQAEGCPTVTEGTLLLSRSDEGYCLLYPEEYQVQDAEGQPLVLFVGSILNHEDPKVSIAVDDAGGRTAEKVTDALLKEYAGFEIGRTSIQVGGEDAVMLDRVPGQDFYRLVIVVHAGRAYTLQFFPLDEGLESYERAVTLYDLVIGSFHFLEPDET